MEQINPTPGNVKTNDTIAAAATPATQSAIALIRISGADALAIAEKIFKGKKNLKSYPSHTAHVGYLIDTDNQIIDHCVATIFKAPNSFTGENIVEFSIHGSQWIASRTLHTLSLLGARPANPGEFTMRAFLNGKIDLTQAEAIADLIAASSEASNKIAIRQMRGTFTKVLQNLHSQLLHFASMLELELDFPEEDVEFANREKLSKLASDLLQHINRLTQSYKAGKVLKKGIPVAITGIPNAGKSTLLNLLLNDDKAIVSDISGTTRDLIEDTTEINGYLYRFIDTAGLRPTSDPIEQAGINKAIKAISNAQIIIRLLDITSPIAQQVNYIKSIIPETEAKIITVANKCDTRHQSAISLPTGTIKISAKTGAGLQALLESIDSNSITNTITTENTIITNARHYAALSTAATYIRNLTEGIASGTPADILALDLRAALDALSEITGTITSADILHNIFSHFCIGK